MSHSLPKSRIIRLSLLSALAVFVSLSAVAHSATAAQAKPAPDDDTQVLTRGPVHEAFAETVTFDPQPGVVVPKAPPQAVEELPPDQRPEGDNVSWIPGYWAWDDERNDYLWISGIWRDMPPGRQWVSGYWREAGDGYQWVSGYWAGAQQEEVEFLAEAPPATLEAGPNVPAPSPDQAWIPGCWTWRESRYAWRPGFWSVMQPGWVWVPAYYVWSPGGFVLVGGYWDYPVVRRGVLFAPVFFNAGIYAAPGYFYTPATVINLAVFSDHLFLRPSFGHYYFGDYYAASYGGMGFYPWFGVNIRHGYDPIFAHQQWQHRHDRDWQQRVEASYQNRREHEDARPPRTWTAEMGRGKSGVGGDKSGVVAVSLDQMSGNKDMPVKLRSIDKQQRDKLAAQSKEIQQFRQQRKELEAKTPPAQGNQVAKAKLPTSPFVTKSSGQKAIDQGLSVKRGLPGTGTGPSGAGIQSPRAGRTQKPPQQAASGPSTTGPTPGTGAVGQDSKKGNTPDVDRSTINRRRTTASGPSGTPGVTQGPGPLDPQVNPDALRRKAAGRQYPQGGNQPNPPSGIQDGPNTRQGLIQQQQQQQQMRRQQLGAQGPQGQGGPNLGKQGGAGPSQQFQGGPQGIPSQRQFNAGPTGPQGPQGIMRRGQQGPPRPQPSDQPPDKRKDPRENR